ncbi:hypothetical protein [Labrys sp. (in: a-proteobacteria)]|uniref:hypothetical protein n=1 Tax=Labrys sp. (in: a-proteobacteria) TaxID=1917972 RepID=UPI0039E30FA7
MGDESDTEPRPERFTPANDNSSPHSDPDAETWRRIDDVALRLARIIGRRMAREDFERHNAANDSSPIPSEGTEDGADRD